MSVFNLELVVIRSLSHYEGQANWVRCAAQLTLTPLTTGPIPPSDSEQD